MNSGIFVVDKPLKMTSNQLVQKIKSKFNLKKVGHAGTLDPMATGVMIVLVNQATKLSDLLLNETKQYEVKMQLYQATSTGDIEGEVIDSTPNLNLNQVEIETMLAKYNHYEYDQVPPIYSAIKVNGKKLYEYARSGNEVELKSRKVKIIETKFIGYDQTTGIVSFSTTVSKGTYIRSLVVDMAADLNTVGHLIALRRTASGKFNISQAKSVEQLSESDLISSIDVVNQLEIAKFELNDQQYQQVSYGQKLTLPIKDEFVFLTYHQQLIALYQLGDNQVYQSVKNNLE